MSSSTSPPQAAGANGSKKEEDTDPASAAPDGGQASISTKDEEDKSTTKNNKTSTKEDENTKSNTTSTEEEVKNTTSIKKEDATSIEDITATLGGVSIAPKKPSIEQLTAPSSIKNIAKMLASKKHQKVLVLTGAGVSCNAGIPDFRTPGTGLYDNLQKYNLPFPEAVFDLGFYARNPDPFVQLASELWPGLKHSPTITHSFIALLEKKGMLLRAYTQNIDMLDVLAGVSEERMIECHGHFRTASCISCSREFDGEECKRIIVEEKRAPSCKNCKGHVKPDIGKCD
jgi:hypothetical protein